MSGRQRNGLAQEPLPTSPRRRRHVAQPPTLLTTTLGNAHISSHAGRANPQTPISTTSLSSPFSVHQALPYSASPYPSSPSSAMRGSSPMVPQATSSINAAYNPQQWGAMNSNCSSSSRTAAATTGYSGHGSRLAPRLVGPDEPVASPPPPYTPRRDDTQENSARPTADITSPADTVSPYSEPSQNGTPVSAATTVSPDFAPKHQNGRSPLLRSQQFFTDSPGSASGAFLPPPPALGASAASRVRSASRNHTDRLISSLNFRGKASSIEPTDAAIDRLQQTTAQAIAIAPLVLQEESVLRPPASRRAASTGAIGLSGASSRSASRSTSQSRWEPGMPLPPPPPGPPPPTARSQSLNRAHPANASTIDLVAPSRPRTRLAPANGTSLGPVPPTPADWREEDQGTQTTWSNRCNGPLPLHIDTENILQSAQVAFREESPSVTVTPINMNPSQVSQTRRDSSNGTLIRSPAIRNRSAKGIRERRSESRNGKERAAGPSSAAHSRDSYLWFNDVEDVKPTDLVLPPSRDITRRRTSTRSTPKSGKSIRSLDEALSSTFDQMDSESRRHVGSNATTPRDDTARSAHLEKGINSSSPSAASDLSQAVPGMLTPPASANKVNAQLFPEAVSSSRILLPANKRAMSDERPVSHLLHIPNSEVSMQAPLLPLQVPSEELQADLLGPESPTAFAQRANDRHRRFAEREAAADNDCERLDLFVDFILAESRIRRDHYAAVFEQEDINVKDLVQGLFAPPKGTDDEEIPQDFHSNTKAETNQSLHASTASESSAQGSLWHGESGAASGRFESPITASSNASPQIRPESSWWNDYIPSLSPIASMSIVTGQDEMDSRGRAPSRWFEDCSRESSNGDAFRVLRRSKRESKYMGVPREARYAPATFEGHVSKSRIQPGFVEPPILQGAYGPDEYPPEKTGWHEESELDPPPLQPQSPVSVPYLSDSKKLDISRLITLPPPYPRHHPAVNNNHPDLAEERTVVRTLHDPSEPNTLRESFSNKMAEKRQRAESWCKHQRSIHEQDIQFKMEHGDMSQEDFDQAEADVEAKLFQSEKEVVQTDFDMFQEMVVSPLHALFAERITKATSTLDVLSRRLFSDAQQHSPNLPQEEGDEQAELLEKLTQLKWLFEARENLHSQTYQLLSERNEKYKAAILLPYQHSQNREKLAEAESFFAKDAHDRRLAFEQATASRCEAFLAVIENNVARGVEVQLSAFWDIAPLLLQVLQNIPFQLYGFEIQISRDEFEENPLYYDHPLQYLHSLLSHAEKSTYQFIESQINLLCLLHEIRSLALAARFRVEETTAGGDDWASRMAEVKLKEEKALMDDLKDKVSVVEGQWIEGLGSRIRGERERVRDWLVETGGWDEDVEWE